MITRDEWLKALTEAGTQPEHDADAVTTEEFATMMGLPTRTAFSKLQVLIKAGKAERTRKRVQASRGTTTVTAYRLVR